MSAHSASQRRSWLSALVAQAIDFVFEEIEPTVDSGERVELAPRPVVAVVSAEARSGATTVARLLAAELGTRADGAAVVAGVTGVRRAAPPSRAAVRLATALSGAAAQPVGRLCLGAIADGAIASAARYLAPVVLDVPPDGSAARLAPIADRVVVVGSAAGEPALLDAVAAILGGEPLKVVNRVGGDSVWRARADIAIPDSKLAARAAALGSRAIGPLGNAVAALADALEVGG